MSKPIVTYLRILNGAGTRVTFADGQRVDFIGRMPKGVAVKQAAEVLARDAARVSL